MKKNIVILAGVLLFFLFMESIVFSKEGQSFADSGRMEEPFIKRNPSDNIRDYPKIFAKNTKGNADESKELTQADKNLLESCRKADYPAAAQAIREGADPNARDKKKNTALIVTAQKKCREADAECREQTLLIAGLLTENGAMTDSENIFHHTALHEAIRRRNRPLVKYFVQKGASLEKAKLACASLVSYRRSGGKFESSCAMLKLLGNLGMDLDTDVGGLKLDPPLIRAVKIDNDPEMVCCLLEAGADPFAVNGYLQTSLMWIATLNEADSLQTALLHSLPEQVNMKNNYGTTALHFAAGHGRFKNAELLLDAGADVNAETNDGTRPLCSASKIRYKHLEKDYIATARLLIQRGADINAVNRSGDTPLFLASENGYPGFIRILLENGADPNIKNKGNDTPLCRLAMRGHTEAVKILCAGNADVNMICSRDDIALKVAIVNYRTDIALELIAAGSDIDYRDHHGETALFDLVFRGPELKKIAEKLLEHKADVNVQNKDGMTPLMVASANPKGADYALMLMENGADIHLKNIRGKTALFYAAQRDKTFLPVIRRLMDMKADVNVQTDRDLETAMMVVRDAEIGLMLTEGDADVNLKDKKGKTALSYIAAKGESFRPLVRRLIGMKADVNVQDRQYGKTPLMLTEDAETAIMLIDGGADIHLKDESGKTVLLYIAGGDETFRPLVRRLIEMKADVNVQDNRKMSPLMLVKDIEIAKMLMEAGADIHLRNRIGKTAYDYAMDNKKKEIKELLGRPQIPAAP